MQENAFEVFFKTTLGGRENIAVSINRLALLIEQQRLPSVCRFVSQSLCLCLCVCVCVCARTYQTRTETLRLKAEPQYA
jgi:hypothetical protein